MGGVPGCRTPQPHPPVAVTGHVSSAPAWGPTHPPTHPAWFVQVAGETEVKAQIKLRFFTEAHQPVVVIRSFQLTQV